MISRRLIAAHIEIGDDPLGPIYAIHRTYDDRDDPPHQETELDAVTIDAATLSLLNAHDDGQLSNMFFLAGWNRHEDGSWEHPRASEIADAEREDGEFDDPSEEVEGEGAKFSLHDFRGFLSWFE